jgi:hypothetical protein
MIGNTAVSTAAAASPGNVQHSGDNKRLSAIRSKIVQSISVLPDTSVFVDHCQCEIGSLYHTLRFGHRCCIAHVFVYLAGAYLFSYAGTYKAGRSSKARALCILQSCVARAVVRQTYFDAPGWSPRSLLCFALLQTLMRLAANSNAQRRTARGTSP